MADDLDDEWWLDNSKDGETSPDQGKSDNNAKKRKHETIREVDNTDHVKTDKDNNKIEKKKKKRKRKPKIEDVSIKLEGSSASSVLWETFCSKCGSKLTDLELEDLKIDESCCLVEDSVHSGDANELSPYLGRVLPFWGKQVEKLDKKKIAGSPLLLVVTSAARRAVELNKSLDQFKSGCEVAKLFAKHFKIEEQAKFLNSKVVHMGIGTPNRILKLIKSDSLKTSQLKYVVFDWTWRDQKLRSLMDIPEVLDDMKSLLQEFLLPLAKSAKIQVGLF
ncbi:predicted protein [Nematostella vectensis]|uniref:Protein CMSS1 n=1 Tax=Nematostella vectensis TaxID=45351 RepID=A7SC17_NEMVE|nr:protein CMSS1 [Nematostella vectensis]EDO38728.1 predicted protein [Nematostella vectensis]|eukprot:XP_001630791.1 predicted protein [Nematostella vectensis]